MGDTASLNMDKRNDGAFDDVLTMFKNTKAMKRQGKNHFFENNLKFFQVKKVETVKPKTSSRMLKVNLQISKSKTKPWWVKFTKKSFF